MVLFGLFVVVRFVVWGLVALVYVCLYFPLPGSCTNISRRQEKGTGHILNPGGSFVPEKGEVVSNALGTARCRVCTQMNREQAERLKLPVSCSCHADLCIHYLSCSFSDTEWNKITVPVCRAHVLQFATNHFGNVCVKQSLKIQLSEYSLICLNVNDYKDSILLQAINLQLFKIDFFLWLAGIYSSWVVTRCLNVKTVIFTLIASVCLSGNGFDFFQHASQILQFGGQLKEKEMLCK